MSEMGNILMIIPARGGSKRLPRKNVLPLAGKPLICWTIEAAINSGLNARVMVTSDDDEILSVASKYTKSGVICHKRASKLSTDTAATSDVILDAVEAERQAGCNPEIVVLLQPTSPLRRPEHIIDSIALFKNKGGEATVVSVCETDHPKAWIGEINDDGVLTGIDISGARSQSYKKNYRLNGAIYIYNVKESLRTNFKMTSNIIAFLMDARSSLDIDSEWDFKQCEYFFHRKEGFGLVAEN